MSGVPEGHLAALYATTDDPWQFRTSAYEAYRFAAIADALGSRRYAHILELGCGNGALAAHLAPRAERYCGLDAVVKALDAARTAVPAGRFVCGILPCELPADGGAPYDLIVLSEVLYFLDEAELHALAGIIDRDAPAARLIAVNWRGPSGNRLDGEEALRLFCAATSRRCRPVHAEDRFRIDALSPLGAMP